MISFKRHCWAALRMTKNFKSELEVMASTDMKKKKKQEEEQAGC